MTTTSTMIIIITVMLSINSGLYLLQEGVSEINPLGDVFFDVDDSPYGNYVSNGELVVDSDLLPVDEAVESGSTGNIFTDTYTSIKSWTQQTLAPLGFIANILQQPYGFLNDVGVPAPVALTFGVLWYMLAIIVIVSWWSGR
jgi:hypothetical protein